MAARNLETSDAFGRLAVLRPRRPRHPAGAPRRPRDRLRLRRRRQPHVPRAPGRPAHAFAYNTVGLDSVYDPPDVPGLAEDRTFYEYDLDRDLTRIVRPDSTIDFAYDSAGRVDAITSPRGVVDYAYSATTGQLTGITAPGGEALGFAYDGALPTAETWTGTVAGQVAFAYDDDFRLSGLAVNGDTVAYGYDDDGLLTAAGDLALNRDPLNGLLRSTHLGAVTTRQGHNVFGEVSGDSAWASGALVFARTYQRDDLGRISEVEDLADGVTTVWAYGYDDAGRLETVTRDGGAYASYAYDSNGNRLSRTSPLGVETGVYDAQDRLLSYAGADYSYTANGELSMKVEGADTTRYEYDVFGNLVRLELPSDSVIEYVIDGRNRRVGKKVDGVLVQGFLYGDQLNPVAELDGSGNLVSRFIYGSKANVPDYMVRGGETFRVVSDHLGSVRMVVNASTGAVAQRLAYDAWGRVLEDTNPGWQPFGFGGGAVQHGTSFVRFGARDYDPGLGRWTARDPWLLNGGDSNVYGFALEDPVNFIDPTGNIPLAAIVGAVVGGAFNFFQVLDATCGDVSSALGAGFVGALSGAFAGLGGGLIVRGLTGWAGGVAGQASADFFSGNGLDLSRGNQRLANAGRAGFVGGIFGGIIDMLGRPAGSVGKAILPKGPLNEFFQGVGGAGAAGHLAAEWNESSSRCLCPTN